MPLVCVFTLATQVQLTGEPHTSTPHAARADLTLKHSPQGELTSHSSKGRVWPAPPRGHRKHHEERWGGVRGYCVRG